MIRAILVVIALASGAAWTAEPNCPPAASWLRLNAERPAAVSAAELIDDMARRDVVLLGEEHTEADHHRWQLHTLAALHVRRPQMVIGFEMFARRAQPVLDRWVAGKLTAERFLAEVKWDEGWAVPPEHYMPLFEFARLHRIPMLALNIDKKLTEAIAERGFDAVPEAEREGISRPAPAPQAYRDFLLENYREHATMRGKDGAKTTRNDAGFRHFVESQQTWDRAMAEALARRVKGAPAGTPALAVGIVGSGHIRHGYGIPLQLRDQGVSRIGSLIPIADRGYCSELKSGFADAVFMLPQAARDKPPPPRLGVRLESQQGAGVKLAEVTKGSLAERSGLQTGDVVVSLAGKSVSRISAVIEAVRRQPDGTWLPMQVKRGEETRELIVKFPPKP